MGEYTSRLRNSEMYKNLVSSKEELTTIINNINSLIGDINSIMGGESIEDYKTFFSEKKVVFDNFLTNIVDIINKLEANADKGDTVLAEKKATLNTSKVSYPTGYIRDRNTSKVISVGIAEDGYIQVASEVSSEGMSFWDGKYRGETNLYTEKYNFNGIKLSTTKRFLGKTGGSSSSGSHGY